MRSNEQSLRLKRIALGLTSAVGLALAFANADALTLTGGVGLAGGVGITGIGNQCVQVGGVDSTAAGPVTGYSCNDNLNQVWEITNGRVKKINNGAAMCLAAGATAGDGAVLQACGTSTSQLWTLSTAGELINEGSGLCLDWALAYTTNGSQLDVEVCTGSPQQQFWPR
jgi:non-reducing end alpha-L-arabinofuranosidase